MTRIVISSVVLLFLTVGCSSKGSQPVVGMADGVSLFADEELTKDTKRLAAGMAVKIVAIHDKAVQVKTETGEEGWLAPYALCSLDEFERRKSASELPTSIICLGHEDGSTFMYGGSLTIQNNQLVIMPGQGVWMDPTMKGKEFSISNETLVGDPAVLFLVTEYRGIRRLPISR